MYYFFVHHRPLLSNVFIVLVLLVESGMIDIPRSTHSGGVGVEKQFSSIQSMAWAGPWKLMQFKYQNPLTGAKPFCFFSIPLHKTCNDASCSATISLQLISILHNITIQRQPENNFVIIKYTSQLDFFPF